MWKASVPNGSNFARLPNRSSVPVTIHFAGQLIVACEGDTVAAALLAAGHIVTRTTPVSGADRGPFCMMGVCFDCLVEIDGETNRQGCMVEVREGMRIEAMRGARQVGNAEHD